MTPADVTKAQKYDGDPCGCVWCCDADAEWLLMAEPVCGSCLDAKHIEALAADLAAQTARADAAEELSEDLADQVANLIPAMNKEAVDLRARAEAAEAREAALLATNGTERQTLIRHNAAHAAPIPTLASPGVTAGAALRVAYRLGFEASAEGWNGEYPFDGEVIEANEKWIAARDRALASLGGGE